MKLRGKFTAVFAVAALTPILVAALVLRVTLLYIYKNEARNLLANARRAGEAQFHALAREVQDAAGALADPHDRDIHDLLIDLQRGAFDEERQRELAHRAPELLRERGLDLLEIVDPAGRVLACGHVPARVGETDPDALARAGRFAGQPLLVEEHVLAGGRLEPALAVETLRWARLDGAGAGVLVVAGRKLDARFLEGLHQHGRLEARLTSPGGATEIAALPEGWDGPGRHPSDALALAGADHVVRAWLELAVPDTDRRSVVEGTTQAITLGAAGALLVALVLGLFVAHRITQPVREMARGAEAIARGRLDVRLESRPRSDELWDLVRAFNTMTEELLSSKEQLVQAERVAAWREIARRLAHEIKNPLTPIQMSIETMRKTQGRAEFAEIFDESTRTILDEVARLKHIVQEFSDFARMPKPELAPCDLGEVARGALALYQGGAAPVRAELPDSALPAVNADKQQLQQVILNLLENARDAVRRKGEGEIVVRARRNGASVELEVEDTGIGLSDAVRERLFTPYFTTKESGTGLGLAIVHRIVTDHGGRITVRGREGQGASFTIALPVAVAAPPLASGAT